MSRKQKEFPKFIYEIGNWSVKKQLNCIYKGMPTSVFDKLKFSLDTSVSEMCTNMGLSNKTIHRRKEEGKLNPIESEKILRLIKILLMAYNVFKDADKAVKWVKTKQKYLGDVSPFSLCNTEVGGQEVTNLLGRLQHGVFA